MSLSAFLAQNAIQVENRKKLIEDGDAEATIIYYCLHKLHITPSEFFEKSPEERATIVAAIEVRAEREKEQMKEAERQRNKTPRGKRRR